MKDYKVKVNWKEVEYDEVKDNSELLEVSLKKRDDSTFPSLFVLCASLGLLAVGILSLVILGFL